MFWDLMQQRQIHGNRSRIGNAERKAHQATRSYEVLDAKIERLALSCQALWEILQQHTDISQEQLLAKMEEIDLRDGKQDGKMSPGGKTCSQCGRRVGRQRHVCLYCGGSCESDEVFGVRK